MFADVRLNFLVFDEAHTFAGAQGSETACLIRRLRAFCSRKAQDTVCIATSATIADQRNHDAARDFASRFFGVAREMVVTVSEAYEAEVWAGARITPPKPKDASRLLTDCVKAVEDEENDGAAVHTVYRALTGAELAKGAWPEALYDALALNEVTHSHGSDLYIFKRMLPKNKYS